MADVAADFDADSKLLKIIKCCSLRQVSQGQSEALQLSPITSETLLAAIFLSTT